MDITADDERLLNFEMQKLCPGYRVFCNDEFMRAVSRAAAVYQKDKRVLIKGSVNLALLMRRVLTDFSQDGHGVPFGWWWIAFESHMLLGIKQDPWTEVKWWLWLELRGKGENLTMWGCQNSLKTSWMARFAVVQMAVWLEDAEVYVAGPYKAHTDDKAWNELKKWIIHLRKNPNQFTSALNLGFKDEADSCKILDKESGRAGTAKFISLENASAAQGKKAAEHETRGLRGILLLIIDEFIENPQLKLRQAEGNVASNYAYFGLLACNPLPEKVQHPSLLPFSEPCDVNRQDLHRDQNFRWRTIYGLCVRFAWKICPNNILGRTVWPYMLTKERMERARKKGNDIIDSQVDAWGFGSGARNAPLDEASIRMAGTYNQAQWDITPERLVHIDCAFGGSDPATYTILDAGLATIINNDNWMKRRVFAGVEQGVMSIDADFIATKDWIDEMMFLFGHTGGGFPTTTHVQSVKPGDRMGGGWHLAYKTLKVLFDHDIPATHCSFDSSQRGDCTTIMIEALGRDNVSWYYEGSRKLTDEESKLGDDWYKWPYQYEEKDDATGQMKPILWSKYCSQCISMIWFFACELIRHGYLIEGTRVDKGLIELCARTVVRGRQGQTEGRRDVLGKTEMKKMGLASPTWGEGLATALYFGTRFLRLIQIDGPQLATTIAQALTLTQVIRAPGNNLKFRKPKSSPSAPPSMPMPSGRTHLTDNQNLMNRLAIMSRKS